MSRLPDENLRKSYFIFSELLTAFLMVIALRKLAHRKLETKINLENHYSISWWPQIWAADRGW